MRVRTLDGTEAAGTSLLLAVLEHAPTVPVGPFTADLGKAAIVDGSGVVWFVGTDGVDRLVCLSCPCEHVELTTYSLGVEFFRTVTADS